MNNDQIRYFDTTPAIQFNLKDWAKIADSLDPTTLDRLWTSQALRRLKNSEREAERAAYNRLSRVKQTERLEIFSIVVADVGLSLFSALLLKDFFAKTNRKRC
jgi:hypothetical protein